ncbi:hypothetical protein [Natrinema pallidum]|uniref:Uncharacterized protein n=1 Tax=Natrinema pallidum TaxID=69527 RepID=A0A4P9TFF2_9EURY|nr:hypothetical protein [Natrinema pallidum]QCW02562.1 hypothetical protein FGF80_04630 [Natrinema pallidum]
MSSDDAAFSVRAFLDGSDTDTPDEQWAAALETARPLFERQAVCYREESRPALADAGSHIVDYDELSAVDRQQLREYSTAACSPFRCCHSRDADPFSTDEAGRSATKPTPAAIPVWSAQ